MRITVLTPAGKGKAFTTAQFAPLIGVPIAFRRQPQGPSSFTATLLRAEVTDDGSRVRLLVEIPDPSTDDVARLVQIGDDQTFTVGPAV